MHDFRLEVRAQVFRNRLNYVEIADAMNIPLRDLLALMRTPLDEKNAKRILDAIDKVVEREEVM